MADIPNNNSDNQNQGSHGGTNHEVQPGNARPRAQAPRPSVKRAAAAREESRRVSAERAERGPGSRAKVIAQRAHERADERRKREEEQAAANQQAGSRLDPSASSQASSPLKGLRHGSRRATNTSVITAAGAVSKAQEVQTATAEEDPELSDAEYSNTAVVQEKTRNPIARLVNSWFDRVMGGLSNGGLSQQEEQYAAHRTTRDFIWNSIGVGAWGMVFPLLTMIATQLAGVEQAGMLSMAFVTGTLLMYIGNFGVRTFQVSDIEEQHSFADYQVNRWITCVLMVLVGVAYCLIRGYETEMFYISIGVYLYRMVDGLADVYEGRLQQVDKLYLSGISQSIRSVAALVAFAILLFITRNMVVASFAMAIAAGVTFVIVTYPLTLLETPKSKSMSFGSVAALFKNTAPLFLALFLYALIDNMPKFVMEGTLSYDNQLYFNAMYFPAQGILITSQLVYKPLLVRLAGVWQDPTKKRKFDLMMVGMFLIILVITGITIAVMAWIGITIMSFLYGIDFEQFRGLIFIMLAAGGITAAIDFLYQVITIMRRQKDVTMLYIVTFGFSLFVPVLLVMFTGLPGASLSYLIVMTILFVLLIWEYARIRKSLGRNPQPQSTESA